MPPRGASAQSGASVRITATDPGLTGSLGDREPLFVRLAYRTNTPVYLELEGISHGLPVPGESGGMQLATPESGVAMLWIEFSPGTTIDAVRVSTVAEPYDRRISSFDVPGRLTWVSGHVRSMSERAGWAVRVFDDQQRPRPMPPPSVTDMVVGTLFLDGLPLAYVALQIWTLVSWRGAWRKSALAPLPFACAAILWSAYAFADQSNLAFLPVVLMAPLGFGYLGLLAIARLGATRQIYPI